MIVVTGGAGFIGSNIVAALAARGEDVVVSDALGSDERWKNLAKHKVHDILSPRELFDTLKRASQDIRAVIHMGAISSTTERDVDLILRNNVRLSLDLWEWCGEHKVRFLYASSAATYGDGQAGFDDETTSAALARLRPLNPYGWSKHVIDRRIVSDVEANRTAPPQWAGLKFFNVYGPNEYHKAGMKSVVAQMYPDIVRSGRVSLFKSHREGVEDGGQTRDFIYVEDVVAVVLWLLETPDVSGLFNVGTGQARTFADLAQAAFSALGREPEINYRDMPEELRARYQYFTEANMERLRAAGFASAFTSIEDGVAEYIKNYLDTDDPYK